MTKDNTIILQGRDGHSFTVTKEADGIVWSNSQETSDSSKGFRLNSELTKKLVRYLKSVWTRLAGSETIKTPHRVLKLFPVSSKSNDIAMIAFDKETSWYVYGVILTQPVINELIKFLDTEEKKNG